MGRPNSPTLDGSIGYLIRWINNNKAVLTVSKIQAVLTELQCHKEMVVLLTEHGKNNDRTIVDSVAMRRDHKTTSTRQEHALVAQHNHCSQNSNAQNSFLVQEQHTLNCSDCPRSQELQYASESAAPLVHEASFKSGVVSDLVSEVHFSVTHTPLMPTLITVHRTTDVTVYHATYRMYVQCDSSHIKIRENYRDLPEPPDWWKLSTLKTGRFLFVPATVHLYSAMDVELSKQRISSDFKTNWGNSLIYKPIVQIKSNFIPMGNYSKHNIKDRMECLNELSLVVIMKESVITTDCFFEFERTFRDSIEYCITQAFDELEDQDYQTFTQFTAAVPSRNLENIIPRFYW